MGLLDLEGTKWPILTPYILIFLNRVKLDSAFCRALLLVAPSVGRFGNQAACSICLPARSLAEHGAAHTFSNAYLLFRACTAKNWEMTFFGPQQNLFGRDKINHAMVGPRGPSFWALRSANDFMTMTDLAALRNTLWSAVSTFNLLTSPSLWLGNISIILAKSH